MGLSMEMPTVAAEYNKGIRSHLLFMLISSR
jgi:hypothetical protein